MWPSIRTLSHDIRFILGVIDLVTLIPNFSTLRSCQCRRADNSASSLRISPDVCNLVVLCDQDHGCPEVNIRVISGVPHACSGKDVTLPTNTTLNCCRCHLYSHVDKLISAMQLRPDSTTHLSVNPGKNTYIAYTFYIAIILRSLLTVSLSSYL